MSNLKTSHQALCQLYSLRQRMTEKLEAFMRGAPCQKQKYKPRGANIHDTDSSWHSLKRQQDLLFELIDGSAGAHTTQQTLRAVAKASPILGRLVNHIEAKLDKEAKQKAASIMGESQHVAAAIPGQAPAVNLSPRPPSESESGIGPGTKSVKPEFIDLMNEDQSMSSIPTINHRRLERKPIRTVKTEHSGSDSELDGGMVKQVRILDQQRARFLPLANATQDSEADQHYAKNRLPEISNEEITPSKSANQLVAQQIKKKPSSQEHGKQPEGPNKQATDLLNNRKQPTSSPSSRGTKRKDPTGTSTNSSAKRSCGSASQTPNSKKSKPPVQLSQTVEELQLELRHKELEREEVAIKIKIAAAKKASMAKTRRSQK